MKKIQLLKKFCNAPKRELVRKICFWNIVKAAFLFLFLAKKQDAFYLVQKLFGIFCLQVDPDGKTDFVLAKSSEFSRQLFNSGTSSCSAISSIKLAVDNLPKFTNCSGLHDGLTQWGQFASSSIKSEIAWRWPSPFIRPLWREAASGFNQWK